MAKVEFQLNPAGVRELLKSPAMLSGVEGLARAAVSRLGSGYEVTTHVGVNRVNAEVSTGDTRSRRDNSDHNAILKAVGSVKA